MYKILHLFRIEKFTEAYIIFINKNFYNNSHEFWIYGNRQSDITVKTSLYKNVKYIKNIERKLKTMHVYDFDKIIYHGVFEDQIIDFFYKNRRLLKKLYLYFWGGDKFIHQTGIKKFRKKYVVNNAHAVINIIPEERKYMKDNYKVKGKFFCALYYSYSITMTLNKLRLCSPKDKDYVAIQVGNSATATNNHISILRELIKFKDENIKIFVPLSYGDKDYRSKVIEFGKQTFGEKFVGMTDFMKEENYYEFMNNIDVAIFGLKRQQARGNINALMFLGKKVFLKRGSVLAHYYRKECNCNIEFVEDIRGMNFEELIRINEEKKTNNERRMEELYRMKPRIEQWNQIFDDKI